MDAVVRNEDPIAPRAATLPRRAPLKVRRPSFELDAADVPERWWGDDLFLSLFGDALSLVFPEGERFFVESVRRFKDDIDDPELRAAAIAFAGQEAMHGREHRAWNDLLVKKGLTDAPELEAQVKRLLDTGRRVLSPRAQLAVTCALEHFTASMAEQLMEIEDDRHDIHPKMRPLWLWHAVEESEHKAVAFDVYQAVGGTYGLRVAIMLLTTALFLGKMSHIHVRFLARKKTLWNARAWAHGIDHLWRDPGMFRKLVPAYLDYFRPGFHPNDRDADALLELWTDRLFGPNGEITRRTTAATPALRAIARGPSRSRRTGPATRAVFAD